VAAAVVVDGWMAVVVVVDGWMKVAVGDTIQASCTLVALLAGGRSGMPSEGQQQVAEADKPAQPVSAVVRPHIHLELPHGGYFAHTSPTQSAKL
jgi:hypothetical protein